MMKKPITRQTDRRSILKSSLATLGGALWASEAGEAALQNVNTRSIPSDLKITDLRVAVVRAPMLCPIIRLDTNQGIYGLGEVRDGASPTYALLLKSRLLGENPCNVDRLFRQHQAVRRARAARWRRERHRDGAVGPGRQGLRRAGLPDARREVPRKDSCLRGYGRVS